MEYEDRHLSRKNLPRDGCTLPLTASERDISTERPPLPEDPTVGIFREAVDISLPPIPNSRSRERMRTFRWAVLCILLAMCAGAVLLSVIRATTDDKGGHGWLGGGLPSTGGQAEEESESSTDVDTETEPERETDLVIFPPVDGESESESGTYGFAETESESVTECESESETSPEPIVPDGAYAVVRKDLSEPDRSVGYIQSTANRLPPSIPGEGTRLWSTTAAPTVLIVHTNPYEGYHDGGNWYDPATGPFAETDASGASDGVVALGAELTGILREANVNVIHLRVPISEGESAAVIYARTEEAVRYYCEMYPEIGLVLDLRRSAELTENGEILRTSGTYNGEDCAQVRLSVDGDRATETVSRDIAVAVAVRRALWAQESTISRPVLVKGGTGVAGQLDRVVMLTVELGSAGNSFPEAQKLLAPLGDAIADLVKS